VLQTQSKLDGLRSKVSAKSEMTKPNFQQMPLDHLRAYILEHRNDDEAFHIYIDRKRAQSPKQVPMTIDEAEAELQRRFGQEAS